MTAVNEECCGCGQGMRRIWVRQVQGVAEGGDGCGVLWVRSEEE